MESNYSGVVNGYDVSFLPTSIPDLGFGVPSSSDFDLRMDQYYHQPSIWVPDQDHHFSPPADEIDSENTLLKYVNQLLMEESLAEKQSIFYDSLALRQTEEMLQQVISDSQTQSSIPNNSITTSSSSNSGDYSNSSNSSGLTCCVEVSNSGSQRMRFLSGVCLVMQNQFCSLREG